MHADKGAERMVASFVGSPETVVEGALNAAVIVQRSVDMRFHKGWNFIMSETEIKEPCFNVSGDLDEWFEKLNLR